MTFKSSQNLPMVIEIKAGCSGLEATFHEYLEFLPCVQRTCLNNKHALEATDTVYPPREIQRCLPYGDILNSLNRTCCVGVSFDSWQP